MTHNLMHIQFSPEFTEGFTTFHGITYLGAAAINAPKSECEIQRNMNILNAEQSLNLGIKVTVLVPCSSRGAVRCVYICNILCIHGKIKLCVCVIYILYIIY